MNVVIYMRFAMRLGMQKTMVINGFELLHTASQISLVRNTGSAGPGFVRTRLVNARSVRFEHVFAN